MKIVLGGLLNDADAVAQRVIRSYDPAAHYKANKDNMLKHDAAQLEACAIYLGLNVRGEDNKKLYKNKKVLCDRMILKIESLFDSECDDCKETYRNTLADKPPLVCKLCLQGCHGCVTMLAKMEAYTKMCRDEMKPFGLVWMCHGCLEKNDLSLLQTPKKTGNDAPLEETRTEGAVQEEEEVEEEEEENDRESPRRNRHENSSSNTNVCELYKERKCPHGLTGKRLIRGERCAKNHPPRCHRYCRYGEDPKMGCKFGPECRYYHPKLCRQSVLRRVCLNPDCLYNHLKFTRRHENDGPGDAKPGYPKPGHPQRPERGILNRPQREERDNPWHRQAQDANNRPPPPRARFDSIGSVYTPYPPTVDVRQHRTRKDSATVAERDNSFLERLMENLKEGIISQMNEKIAELRIEIPALVQESSQWNKPTQPSRQQFPLQQMPQLPLQQMPPLSQTTFPYNPTNSCYPGLCY